MKDTETRTLDEYIQAKLGISAIEFAEIYGIPLRTLQYRWNSERGRDAIKNKAFIVFILNTESSKLYVERFDKL